MRRVRALVTTAAAVGAMTTLALAPAAFADYAVNAATTMDTTQSESALTQYGVSRTITFTITNTGDSRAGRPKGTVNFTVAPDPGTSFTSARSVTAGAGSNSLQSTASLTFNADTPAEQSYTVAANFVPDPAPLGQPGAKFASASKTGYVTIFKRPTTTTGSVTNAANATFSVAVAPVNGSGQSVVSPNAGTVTFTVSGGATRTGTGTVSSGVATVDLADLLAGDYSLATSYGGTGNYGSSNGTAVPFSVGTATQLTNVSISGSNGKATATLSTVGGAAIAGRTITFTVSNQTPSRTGNTNASGVATADFSKPTAPCTLTASFAGDASFKPKSVQVGC